VLDIVAPLEEKKRRVQLLELEAAFHLQEAGLDARILAVNFDDEGVELKDFYVDVEENEENLKVVKLLTGLAVVFENVENLDTDPLVLLDSVPYEVVPFRIYTLNLLPAPQYSSAENGNVSFTSLGKFLERSNNSRAARHISRVATSCKPPKYAKVGIS